MNDKRTILVNSYHCAQQYQGGEVVIWLDPYLLKTNYDSSSDLYRVYLTVHELKQLLELAGHAEYDEDGNQTN
jgi:hypothetical protein